jgi:hypothetical protein
MTTNGTPVWSFHERLDSTFDGARSKLFHVKEGRFSQKDAPEILALIGAFTLFEEVEITGGPEKFVARSTGATPVYLLELSVEAGRCAVAIEGQWWYRGVYSMVPVEGGKTTAFTLEVFNISPSGTRLLFPIIRLQGTERKQRVMFHHVAEAANARLKAP